MLAYLIHLIGYGAVMLLLYYNFRALILHTKKSRSKLETGSVYLSLILGTGVIGVCIVAIASILVDSVKHQYFGIGLYVLGGTYLICGIVVGAVMRIMWQLLHRDAEREFTQVDWAILKQSVDLKYVRMWLYIMAAASVILLIITIFIHQYLQTLVAALFTIGLIYATYKLRDRHAKN
jgi:hypothetical protein